MLYEWQTGKHKPVDFAANSFMDVYSGHMNTLQHVQESKPDVKPAPGSSELYWGKSWEPAQESVSRY